MWPQLIAAGISAASQPSGAIGAPISSGLTSDNVFDSSGWTVATGGSSASGNPTSSNPYLIGAAILAATLIAIVWLKK